VYVVHMCVCGAYVCMWCICVYVVHMCVCGAYVCMWCICVACVIQTHHMNDAEDTLHQVGLVEYSAVCVMHVHYVCCIYTSWLCVQHIHII